MHPRLAVRIRKRHDANAKVGIVSTQYICILGFLSVLCVSCLMPVLIPDLTAALHLRPVRFYAVRTLLRRGRNLHVRFVTLACKYNGRFEYRQLMYENCLLLSIASIILLYLTCNSVS